MLSRCLRDAPSKRAILIIHVILKGGAKQIMSKFESYKRSPHLVSLSHCPLLLSYPLIQVPVLQNNNGSPLVGQVTIACHLVKEAKRPDLLGNCAESRAVVQQWLEHRVTQLDGCRKEDIKTVLKVAVLIFKGKKNFEDIAEFFPIAVSLCGQISVHLYWHCPSI